MKGTQKQRDAGFTLIELMIVVAIVSIISSIAVVKTGDAIGTAQDKRRAADIHTFRKGIYMFYQEYEFFPASGNCGAGTGWRTLDNFDYFSSIQDICDPQGNILYSNLVEALADYLPKMGDPKPSRYGPSGGYHYYSGNGSGYTISIYLTPENMHHFDKALWNPWHCWGGGVGAPTPDGQCPSGKNTITIKTSDSIW